MYCIYKKYDLLVVTSFELWLVQWRFDAESYPIGLVIPSLLVHHTRRVPSGRSSSVACRGALLEQLRGSDLAMGVQLAVCTSFDIDSERRGVRVARRALSGQ